MPLDIVRSTCPHDCPSVCALEVGNPRRRHGRRRARRQGQQLHRRRGVRQTARYRERIHHPDRLMQPLLQTGAKGSGEFAPIDWPEALGRVAEAFRERSQKYDPTTVWPYYFAGTMGWVQRNGIDRFRHDLGYSGQIANICTFPADAGWRAEVGKIMGPDPVKWPSPI